MVRIKYTGANVGAILWPVLTIVCTTVLMFAIAPGVNIVAISRGVVGPTTWPKAMLLGIIACAVILLVRAVLALRMSSQELKAKTPTSSNIFRALGTGNSSEEPPLDAVPEDYDNRKAAIGILVMSGYGAGIPVIGFGPATLVSIILLLLLGGMRKPVNIGLVSILGTMAMLYLFVKVTAMPLDRGMGHFNDLNLMLYRLLGIY